MNKILSFALLAIAVLPASSVHADDQPCCASSTSAEAKTSCAKTFAALDLDAEQKAKMEKLAVACDKTGCTKEGMATMEKAAKGILTEKQFATWKLACGKQV